ncbi:glycosyltransferase family 4 protein [Panacibacter ginsenosidivorans]|uniref:Glycosyltransferase family 4 protein n=1 Tax=Panacibacter ginsenosidivorans TaxID=1813871 RepID=A0A5B8V3T7_9BACT|nr:glycosyltransferase family 4 protein [Panacibacter ginsenosidivorans]QEC65828.1 glycosyltransferase family 4 protein [Panacibacter ginsenosidivorans]
MRILWLASWYPNPYEPFNGDFIQRHAQAVAELLPVDVIHVLQAGRSLPVEKTALIVNKKNGLTEYVHVFKFRPFGIAWVDKLWYNILYHRYYSKIIKEYFAKNGKPDLIHVHVPVKAGLIALRLLKKKNIPFIVSEQSSHYEETSPDYFLKRSKYFQVNTRRIFSNAISVTNVSETIGKKLQSYFELKNYRTIHNLVDTDLFYYKQKEKNNKLRFIHVSAMGEQKNPAGIIRALAQLNIFHKEWECVLCGPYKQELKLMVEENELHAQIQFTGEVAHDRVAKEMQQADVFILFSNHENFPCVVAEALCCGLPVIAANAGGVAEAVNDSNGIIVNAGDVEQLTNALHNIVKSFDKYDRAIISANAKVLYNKKRIAEQFVELYNDINNSLINKGYEKPL